MTQATKDMLALAKLHGATVYTHRTMPDNPAVAFGNIDQLAAYTEAVRAQAAPAGWIELTDEDRVSVFQSLPDSLDGFLKKWGWLHFAKAIEAECLKKNAPPPPGIAPSMDKEGKE